MKCISFEYIANSFVIAASLSVVITGLFTCIIYGDIISFCCDFLKIFSA